MPSVPIIGLCLGLLIVLGIWERLERDRDRRAIPIRIHVNGTRGKSTVTRLIWGALHEAGVPVVAKTTGTAPRVLLPDGTERPVRRLAPPSIREQLWLLRLGRRAGARAVVVECMAIQPELQAICEQSMLAATIGVITNVRTDHTDMMGPTRDHIAASLANTIPTGGVLVTGDDAYRSMFAARAGERGTRLVVAAPEHGPGASATHAKPCGARTLAAAGREWQLENRAIALAVTRQLGVPDDVALTGMKKVPADPGAVGIGTITSGGRDVPFVDATAANDPESLEILLEGLLPSASDSLAPRSTLQADGTLLVVYNHRADRADRLRCFATASAHVRNACHLIVTGDRPSLTLTRFVRAQRRHRPVVFVPRRRLAETARRVLAAQPELSAAVFCGNTRGFEFAALCMESGSAGQLLATNSQRLS